MYGRLQQEGRIESFDVALLNPSTGVDGYIALHGSSEQLSAIRDDEEFRRTLYDAALIVQDLSVTDGYTGNGIAKQMAIYEEAISKVPQSA